MDTITKRLVRTGIALLAVALLAAVGCSGEESSLKSVTFMAGFKPQANLPFVAAYVAQEKGYFREQGLDVDIRHSTGQHLTLLISGDVDVSDPIYTLQFIFLSGDPMPPPFGVLGADPTLDDLFCPR